MMLVTSVSLTRTLSEAWLCGAAERLSPTIWSSSFPHFSLKNAADDLRQATAPATTFSHLRCWYSTLFHLHSFPETFSTFEPHPPFFHPSIIMPRIPLRTEPYSSPARQQRHYKSKRDRTLKALGSASHINGSQFAIMLVNAKGDVETYASDLFKIKLPEWFHDAVRTDAKNILLEDKENKAKSGQQVAVEVELSAGDGELYQVSSDVLAYGTTTPPFSAPAFASPEGSPSPSPTRSRPTPPQLSPVDVQLANDYKLAEDHVGDLTTSTFESTTPSTTDTLVSHGSVTNSSALDEWFYNKFHLLQQTTCKLVAKCWIKVVEPKKQNKYPYQKGDESKPEWWPENIRHKEPDHLHKNERHALLLAILKSGRVPVARLELSTAEAMARIEPDRFPILREIYDMAKEQEMRRNDPNYKIRLPLTVVPVTTRNTSPPSDFDDSADASYNPSTSLKRPRPSDENDCDSQPRRSVRRSNTSTSVHDYPVPGDMAPPRPLLTRHRVIGGPGLPSPVAPRGFNFDFQHLPGTFNPHDPAQHWSTGGPQHIPHMPFGYNPFPSNVHFGDNSLQSSALPHDVVQLMARRPSGSAQNMFPEQFNANGASPPSPTSMAMMMWNGYPQGLSPAQILEGAAAAVEQGLPPPHFPLSHLPTPEQAWSADFQRLVEDAEAPARTPPTVSASASISSMPHEGTLDNVDASWLA